MKRQHSFESEQAPILQFDSPTSFLKKTDCVYIAVDSYLLAQATARILGIEDIAIHIRDLPGAICAEARARRPRLIIVDYDLPSFRCGSSIRIMRKAYPNAYLIILISFNSQKLIELLSFLGASAVVSHDHGVDGLLHSMSMVSVGVNSFPTPDIGSEHPLTTHRREILVESLTTKETEVWALLAEGMSNQVIAGHLDISQNTVKMHVHNIFQKLDVSNRVEAANLFRTIEG